MPAWPAEGAPRQPVFKSAQKTSVSKFYPLVTEGFRHRRDPRGAPAISPPVLISTGLPRHVALMPQRRSRHQYKGQKAFPIPYVAHRPSLSNRYFSGWPQGPRFSQREWPKARQRTWPPRSLCRSGLPKPAAAKIAATSSAWPAPISTSTWPACRQVAGGTGGDCTVGVEAVGSSYKRQNGVEVPDIGAEPRDIGSRNIGRI